jgi:protein tyrosine phosphatase (PTP) superfamily phosphohydrolase (DUF442 family)
MNKNRIWQTSLILTTLLFSIITCTLTIAKDNNDVNVGVSTVALKNRQWATEINLPGLPNLHKVSKNLYRGAQPTAEGIKQLKKMGIKTIVNLRSFHSDSDEINDVNLSYEHIYMKAWHAEDEDIVKFLKIATDPNRTPVFVHCQHGADRTGTMCAIYRITVQGWSKDEAIEEMTKSDFGFHPVFDNLPDYIHKLDIEKIKQQAGIKSKVVDN